MDKVVGLVNLHDIPEFEGITSRRSMATTTFLGRYTFIDFVLSNLANSRIDNMGILVKKGLRSLERHLSNSKHYNFNTKTGSCAIMYNEYYTNINKYDTDINNIIENSWFLDQQQPDYVVIAPAHLVYNIDYQKVLEAHKASKADVTMIYHNAHYTSDESYIELDKIELKDNRVTHISKNKGTSKTDYISLESYIINKDALFKMIQFAKETSPFYTLRDVIKENLDKMVVNGYLHEGYFRPFTNVKAYFEYSMELLNQDILNQLFMAGWPIYTQTRDTPPTKYLPSADIKNSIVSNGSIIGGKIRNSIIARNVTVEEGAEVENCVIFSGAFISKNSKLANCIIDKSAKVINTKELIGTKEFPLIVKEKDTV